jgi:hypothetical protein
MTLQSAGPGIYMYQGCFQDGSGPYEVRPWGSGRSLPAALSMTGITVEQCGQAAGVRGFEVFAVQEQGICFMGTLAHVAQMKQKLDDAACSTIPCAAGNGCTTKVNKVYSIGATFLYLILLMPPEHTTTTQVVGKAHKRPRRSSTQDSRW